MTTTSLLIGDGTKKCPYYIHGFRNEESTSLKVLLNLCDREDITKLRVQGSGRYYERRQDGWYETSDTVTCDKFHGLPPEGRKVK
jgi:hypothetical protein